MLDVFLDQALKCHYEIEGEVTVYLRLGKNYYQKILPENKRGKESYWKVLDNNSMNRQ
jgi:hypothetical protein